MGQSVVMKTKTEALTPGAGARGSTKRPSRSRTRRGPAEIGRAIITLAITTASTTQTVTALARDIVQPSTEPDDSIQSGPVKLTGTRARAIAIMSGAASMSQTHAPDADSRHARARPPALTASRLGRIVGGTLRGVARAGSGTRRT